MNCSEASEFLEEINKIRGKDPGGTQGDVAGAEDGLSNSGTDCVGHEKRRFGNETRDNC